MRKKILMYPVVAFVVFYIIYAIGSSIFGGEEVVKPKPQAQVEATEQSPSSQPGRLAGRDLDRLWSTWDWNQTTPGATLAKYVGPDWVNWIIWGVIALLVLVTISRVFGKGGGIGISPTTIIVTLILAAGALGVAHMMRPIESAPAMVKVEFRPGDVGKKSEPVTIGPNTEIWMNFPRASSIDDQNRNGVHRACAEVTGATSVALKAPMRLTASGSGGYLRKFKLSESSRQALQDMRVQTVDVVFSFGRSKGPQMITCSLED